MKSLQTLLNVATLIVLFSTITHVEAEIEFTNLITFSSRFTNGVFPRGGLALATDGSLYGTTMGVSMNGSGQRIRPTIFKITPDAVLETIAWFDSTNFNRPGPERWSSYESLTSALVEGKDHNLYGVAEMGGEFGYGRTFKMTPKGVVTTLHSFEGYSGTNGWNPTGGLIEGAAGSFYGTAYSGGIKERTDNVGMGTIYRVNTNGELKTLFYFRGNNGEFPASSLVRGNDGCYYGTTPYGGPAYTNDPPDHGQGTIFKISTNGAFKTLFSFDGTNGSMPYEGLLLGRDDNFYGTTKFGGGFGTVFKISSDGILTNLFFFNGTNGARPNTILIQGSDGSLYGATEFGGSSFRADKKTIEHLYNETYGTIFRITTNGNFTSLFSFNRTNGYRPSGTLAQRQDGYFFGATETGGVDGGGTIYRFRIIP